MASQPALDGIQVFECLASEIFNADGFDAIGFSFPL